MRKNKFEIRFSGSGGQGVILAGIILGEAASIYDGKNAVQSQSYGPDSRGGASRCEVVISDDEIDYPRVQVADLLLALTQEACNKYAAEVKKDGIVIIDEDMVRKPPDGDFKLYKLPIIRTAKNELGREMVANIISLGLIVGLTGIIKRDSLEKAVMKRVPRGTEELNRKALEVGFELAKKLK